MQAEIGTLFELSRSTAGSGDSTDPLTGSLAIAADVRGDFDTGLLHRFQGVLFFLRSRIAAKVVLHRGCRSLISGEEDGAGSAPHSGELFLTPALLHAGPQPTLIGRHEGVEV